MLTHTYAHSVQANSLTNLIAQCQHGSKHQKNLLNNDMYFLTGMSMNTFKNLRMLSKYYGTPFVIAM